MRRGWGIGDVNFKAGPAPNSLTERVTLLASPKSQRMAFRRTMDGDLMTTLATRKIALTSRAYGFELLLWKEGFEWGWGATLHDGVSVFSFHFEEDNLTLAKLHMLGEARKIALSRSNASNLQDCSSLLDSWKPTSLTNV